VDVRVGNEAAAPVRPLWQVLLLGLVGAVALMAGVGLGAVGGATVCGALVALIGVAALALAVGS
jgi:hypothetical protein